MPWRRGGHRCRHHALRVVGARRLRRRFLGPRRRGAGARPAVRGPDRRGRDPGMGGQPRLADLHPGHAWTAFGLAFGPIMTTLFVPLSLAALGIVLRGANFALRKDAARAGGRQWAGWLFGIGALLTPFFFGASVGASLVRPGPGRRQRRSVAAGGTGYRSPSACSRSRWARSSPPRISLSRHPPRRARATRLLPGPRARRRRRRVAVRHRRGVRSPPRSTAHVPPAHPPEHPAAGRRAARARRDLCHGVCGGSRVALRVVAALGVGALVWAWAVAQISVPAAVRSDRVRRGRRVGHAEVGAGLVLASRW